MLLQRTVFKVKYVDDLMLDRIIRKRARLNTMLSDQSLVLKSLRDMHIEFIHGSTLIEGSKLSLKNVNHIIETGDSILEKAKRYQVISLNHIQAQRYLSSPEIKKQDITVDIIKETHRRLMLFADNQAGKLRENAFNRKDNVEEKLENLLEGLFIDKKFHVIDEAAIFNSFFQKIRPFNYGNGLTARQIMKQLLNRQGYMFSLNLNEYEVKYYRKCENQAVDGVYRPFVNTVASCCERAFESMIDLLKQMEPEKKESKDRIRPETMIDVSYIFDLVLSKP